jgi:hypothetical protein
MINICIDGNYIFHKTFGIFAGYGNVDPAQVLSKKADQAMFIRKVATDLCAGLKTLPAGGRMVFTMDSRSWRKEVEIENGGYKSNRTKDENVDWTLFFELMESFGHQLEKQGFIFSKSNKAEGDDLLYFWSKYFNSINEDCIVLSGDGDLHQLASFDGQNWTVAWSSNNKKNMVTAPIGWKIGWLDKEEEASIFNMSSIISPDKDKIKDLLSKCELNEIDRRDFIMNKVFIGDKGDAVPSIWEIRQNGKTMNFTQKKSDSLMDAIKKSESFSVKTIDEILENEEVLSWVSGYALRIMKDVDSTDNRKKLASNIKRNCVLMYLDEKYMPQEVSSLVKEEIERGISLPKKSITLDRIKILEGTNWITPEYSPSNFDPFSHFN